MVNQPTEPTMYHVHVQHPTTAREELFRDCSLVQVRKLIHHFICAFQPYGGHVKVEWEFNDCFIIIE